MVPGRLLEFTPAMNETMSDLPHDLLGGLPGVLEVQSYGERLHVLVDDPVLRRPQLERRLAAAGIAHDELRETPVHMEEAFIHLVQEQRHLLGEDHPHAQVLKERAA